MERKSDKFNIPDPINKALKKLADAGYGAYLVGGCVRDLLLHKKPKDWDITTNAKPEEIMKLFSETFYENDYGTVGVVNKDVSDETLKVIEITPYRLETAYSDKRRPDNVIFSQNIEDDLKRRDFTINAMALEPYKGQLIDLYKGQDDIKDKLIRAVGEPDERFREDALRVLRAIRLSCELNFAIEPKTEKALQENSSLLEHVSKERIRDEFTRIIMSDHPMKGLELCRKFSILHYIAPDLERGIGVEQGGIHTFDVWEHLMRSVQHTADKAWPLETRLAALFHDIGKPHTRSKTPTNEKWSFYGHELVGARLTRKILTDLKFPSKTIDKVTKLVRWHMFFSDTETITHSAVRRLVANVGKDNVWDLMNVRAADRIGTGRPKEGPYRLRKYHAMIEEVMRDPVSVGMLKIDGSKIMEVTSTKPGPKIGLILHALLEDVLENPALNKEDYLQKRALELIKLPEKELKDLGEKGKKSKDLADDEKVQEIRKRHFVE
jgi:poly(A) polymerase/tRNA nucleotidyltransferase (CCA-adding enzyme)